MGKMFELEPEEVDLIVEALTIYRERWDQYLPGMRQKEEAAPTQITPAEASEVVQRCNAILSRLLGDVWPGSSG